MPIKSSDQAIIATLAEKFGTDPTKVEYDELGNIYYLDISNLGLSHIPPEIGLLTCLRTLDLSGNHMN